MVYSSIGLLANECIQLIPNHFEYCDIDSFVVMPNHVHLIVCINDVIEYKHVGSTDLWTLQMHPLQQLIPRIIQQYKSSVTRIVRTQLGNYEFKWQKSYHDHIIRNDTELNLIQIYINKNPIMWNKDINNN